MQTVRRNLTFPLIAAIMLALISIGWGPTPTAKAAPAAVQINFGPAGRSIESGQTVQFSGTVKTKTGVPIRDHRVQVQRQFGTTWRKVKDVYTNINGAYYVRYAPGATAKYRAVYAGSSQYKLTVSPIRTVTVVVPVRPKFASYGVVRSGKLVTARDVLDGQKHRFEATAQATLRGRTAELQRHNGTGWQTVTKGTVSSTGKVSLVALVTGVGKQNWRILIPKQFGTTVPVATPAISLNRKRATLSGPTPTITGSAVVRATLTAQTGTWTPEGTNLSFQWLRNDSPISGATQRTYRVGLLDAGQSLRVRVIGHTGTDSAMAKSSKTVDVAVPSYLVPGEALASGRWLVSPNGQYRLTQQTGGNLVLTKGTATLWSTGVQASNSRTTVQTNGDIVTYQGTTAKWRSHTAGTSAARFELQNDGRITLKTSSGTVLWSNSESVPNFKLSRFMDKYDSILTDDGRGNYVGECVSLVKLYHDEVVGGDYFIVGGNGGAKNMWLLFENNNQLKAKYSKIPASQTPKRGDLAVFDATSGNQWGHVGIVLGQTNTHVLMFDQSPGRPSPALPPNKNGRAFSKNTLLGYLRPLQN